MFVDIAVVADYTGVVVAVLVGLQIAPVASVVRSILAEEELLLALSLLRI